MCFIALAISLTVTAYVFKARNCREALEALLPLSNVFTNILTLKELLRRLRQQLNVGMLRMDFTTVLGELATQKLSI